MLISMILSTPIYKFIQIRLGVKASLTKRQFLTCNVVPSNYALH